MKKVLFRTMAMMTAVILLFSYASFSVAESTMEEIPEPTLSPEAAPYDTDHPENLEPEQLYGLSAVLITADKGEVIFEKDPYTIRYPASTTKILTVLLGIICVDDLNQKVTVSETAMDVPEDSSKMGLKAGEEIPFIDVLYGTMMLSGNEGANVIAETVSGSIPAFVDLMNESAERFGCVNTHFANAHGYHDDNHYTTAYDMSRIALEAMKNETFRKIAGTVTYAIGRTNLQKARTITTKSEYMLSGTEEKPNKYYFPDATGIKTGSHSHSGYCFVGSASRDGVDLISVVFFTGKRARWADTIKLMNYGFSQYVSITPLQLYQMNPITIETSNYSTSDSYRGRLQLVCQARPDSTNPTIIATRSEAERMQSRIQDTLLIQYTRDFEAPITAGEVMGTATYFQENGEPVVYNLVAARSIAVRENVPKTLEQIVAETYADPNPFPPLTVEVILILLSPLLILLLVVLLIWLLIRFLRHRGRRTPKPVSRYLK
ncbi:MAG: D-alanyl-D-alanine carboxypeptidase [Clostridiales bacterium]|nr:D-alanyl-D-alanine carboxypeptidase [Clostridiales bacterium]